MRTFSHRIAQAIFAAAVLTLSASCIAQSLARTPAHTITIYMLNGKTGKPMHHKSLRAKFPGNPRHITIDIDSRGFGRLQVPAGTSAFSLSAATTGKKHRPAYTVCGPYRDLIPVKDVLAHGYVPLDACSPTLKLQASPGVLLYFIQPLPWYPPSRE